MTIYRAICHNETDIKLPVLGIHWSSEYKSAYPYGNKYPLLFEYYVYIATINEEMIDIAATNEANIEWPWENEIVLLPGKEIIITEIHKLIKPTQKLITIIPITYTSKT